MARNVEAADAADGHDEIDDDDDDKEDVNIVDLGAQQAEDQDEGVCRQAQRPPRRQPEHFASGDGQEVWRLFGDGGEGSQG